MSGTIISGVICGLVALILLGIGISQLRRKTPVGFYGGKEPPKPEEISDVKAWNQKHGAMWILYAFCILGAWISAQLIKNDLYAGILLAAGVFVPLPVMILFHRCLVKKYDRLHRR